VSPMIRNASHPGRARPWRSGRLSGCISVFPKTKPAWACTASARPRSASTKAPPGAMFGVLKAPTAFTRAAAGDRLLTVTNGEVAYIAGARWVSPAFMLFEEATARAFENDPGRARLIGRGEVAKADLVLRLEVRTFEADYVNGPKAAPEVVVRVRARAEQQPATAPWSATRSSRPA
jgi:cholesterol transport system auxiliary component